MVQTTTMIPSDVEYGHTTSGLTSKNLSGNSGREPFSTSKHHHITDHRYLSYCFNFVAKKVRRSLGVIIILYLILVLTVYVNFPKLSDKTRISAVKQEPLKPTERHHHLYKENFVIDRKKTYNGNKLVTVDSNQDPIGILLLACNRVTVRRSLDQLLKYRPDEKSFPILVSQDCNHKQTTRVLRSYGEKIRLIRHPDLSDIPLTGKEKKFIGYYKIARHYAWALNQTFNFFNYKAVVIVEDDLDIAPDFFEYFRATYPILKADPSLYCISAWNDNGKVDLIAEDSADTLYRSDFFPGLGWMLTKDVWLEFQGKWPKAFWDDWIREPAQRKERACIRPEISRTRTFGKVGVSKGMFFEKHLKFIKLNEKFVPFTQYNLTYLLKDNYDDWFIKTVYSSPEVLIPQLKFNKVQVDGPVRITYKSKASYKAAAKSFKLMDDFKSGVPRTGYRGIVSFMYQKRRVFLAPLKNWKSYDRTWS